MTQERDSRSAGRGERMPAVQRQPNFWAPWFDDNRWDPSRWFEDFLGRTNSSLLGDIRSLSPAIDVDESPQEYSIWVDLPGLKREDISIECSGNQLTINAERRAESNDNKRGGRRERYYGTYQRSFTLPGDVEPDQIRATYENGVLGLKIPKAEQARPKRIQIEGGGEGRSRSTSAGKLGSERTEKNGGQNENAS